MPDRVQPPTDPPTTSGAVRPLAGAPVEREFTVAERSQGQLVLRRFLQHRLAVASLGVLFLVVLLAFVGGALWRYDVAALTGDYSQAPSWRLISTTVSPWAASSTSTWACVGLLAL